jgi:serine/threonine-protein kinase
MGLTQKILLFTSLLVVALVSTSLVFTTLQADRLARENIDRGLSETRQVWETFQADRYNKLKLGIRVLGNDPFFKSLIETKDQASILDTLKERNQEIKADFFIATDPAGVVVARTDRPGAQGEDLSKDPLVTKPVEGEESATVWRQGDRLYHAVSVPMVTGPDLKGVLIAGYEINESLASDIRKLTHSEIAYLVAGPSGQPQVSVSSLGPKEPALRSALARPGAGRHRRRPGALRAGAGRRPVRGHPGPAEGGHGRDRGVRHGPAQHGRGDGLLPAIPGEPGAGLAGRDGPGPGPGLRRRQAHHRAGAAPGRLVEKARNGSYSGAVTVDTRDEIGVLARTFNRLLADLREKEQLIGFLREGMTGLRKRAPAGGDRRSGGDRRASSAVSPAASAVSPSAETQLANQATVAIGAVGTQLGASVAQGGLFAERYEVLGTVGKGGMGVVYRARDRQLDEVVALKVVRSEVLKEDPTLLDRFKQEIKLARRITHRNILRTHDFGETAGTPYISMEYLEGVTLKDLLRSKGALPLGVGLRIAKQVCQGLEAAHQQGVVHRDIKPQNILILPETGDLKIMDFGIARVSEMQAGASGLTTAGTVMGTPDYIPPEQAQGNPADFRSDIYSLGVVPLRDLHGRHALQRRHGDGGRPGSHPEAATAAAVAQPQAAAGAGGHHPALPREAARPPLPERGRDPQGPDRGLGGVERGLGRRTLELVPERVTKSSRMPALATAPLAGAAPWTPSTGVGGRLRCGNVSDCATLWASSSASRTKR